MDCQINCIDTKYDDLRFEPRYWATELKLLSTSQDYNQYKTLLIFLGCLFRLYPSFVVLILILPELESIIIVI
jgi:hypothetical protein